MLYFLGRNKDFLLIKFDKDTGRTERFDKEKKEWVRDYKASKLFGKMCIGSIDVDVISEEEAKKLTNE